MDQIAAALPHDHPLSNLPTALERTALRREACEQLADTLRTRPLQLVATINASESARQLELVLRTTWGAPDDDYSWVNAQLDALGWEPDYLRASHLGKRHDYLRIAHRDSGARLLLTIAKPVAAA